MGGADDSEIPSPNSDLLRSSIFEDDPKDSSELKGSMAGWVDDEETQGVLFSKGEVFVHQSSEAKDHINGFLSLIKENGSFFVHWTPKHLVEVNFAPKVISKQPTLGDSALMLRENSQKPSRFSSKPVLVEGPLEVAQTYTVRVGVNQIHSVRKYVPSIGHSYLIIKPLSGAPQPPFYFHEGGLKEFLTIFSGVAHVSRSHDDPNVMLVNDRSNALNRTLSELRLSPSSPPAPMPGVETPSAKLGKINKISQDPTFSIFDGFAKVTQMAREISTTLFDATPSHHARQGISEERRKLLKDYEDFRKRGAQAQAQKSVDSGEVASTPVGIFEVLSSDNATPIEESFRAEPLSPERWYQYFDREGRATDVEGLKKEIFLGGVHPDIRPEVWKFLLGLFAFDSTEEEREIVRQQRKEDYETLKKQWTTISPMQLQYFSKFRERHHRIEKDVVRTDRTHPYYEDDDSDHLRMLNDILVSYTFFNFDLGYVQGMNDLLSPILVTMDNESEAFWCFVGFMDSMRHNFDKDQHGMHNLLLTLRKIVQVVDPQLYQYLEKKDCLNMFFCFRWLLLNFKRELEFSDTLTLWEVIWANPLTPKFPLFLCIAVLEQHKNHFITEDLAFDDILKYVNDLSMNLNIDYLLKEAEILFYKFRKLATTPELQELVA